MQIKPKAIAISEPYCRLTALSHGKRQWVLRRFINFSKKNGLACAQYSVILTGMNDIKPTDSLSVRAAADKLQSALRQLETALMPMQAKLKLLETNAENSAVLDEDRARLARELDEAKAEAQTATERDAQYKEREAEFSQLAEETMREMDMVINQVKQTLGRG